MIDVLRNKFVKFRREIFVKHEDVMLVLECISEVKKESRFMYRYMDMEIGDCSRSAEAGTWYVFFDMTNDQWENLINKLACEDRRIILRKKGKCYLV